MRVNHLKKLLCLIISASAVVTLVSCGSDLNETPDDLPVERVTLPYDDRYEADDLPDYLDLEGETVRLLVWDDAPNLEFDTPDLSGETVNDAVYNRNITVEDRLRASLEFEYVADGADGEDAFSAAVTRIIRSDDASYHIVAGASSIMTKLCGAANFLPLDDVDYLNFEKPWWPDAVTANSRLGGRLYLLTGDISTNFIYRLGVTFFNKSVAEDYAADDFYSVARSGGFTLDYMLSTAASVYTDINGNSKKDYWDRLGYVTADDFTDMLVAASEIPLSKTNPDGSLTLSDAYTGEKLLSLLEKYTGYLYNENGCAIFARAEAYSTFNRGKTLFFTDRIDTYKQIMYSDVVYGVLPLPKYDENQRGYVTSSDPSATLYAVPVSVRFSDTSGAVLEALASESFRRVTPALFDVALKYRYSDSPDDTAMFDLIREGVTFDIFTAMSDTLGYPLFSVHVAENDTDWESDVAEKLRKVERAAEKFLEKLGGTE